MAEINKTVDSECWLECGGRETSFTVGRKGNWDCHSANQYRENPQKAKNKFTK